MNMSSDVWYTLRQYDRDGAGHYIHKFDVHMTRVSNVLPLYCHSHGIVWSVMYRRMER